MTNQAIYQRRFTEIVKFTSAPTKETITALQGNGFTFRHGQWIKTRPTGQVVTEEQLASTLAA